MNLSDLASTLDQLKESSILQERPLLDSLLLSTRDDDLRFIVPVLAGEIPGEVGPITPGTARKGISMAFGLSTNQLDREFRRLGTLPEVASHQAEKRSQTRLCANGRAINSVLRELRAALSGKASERTRVAGLCNLMTGSSPSSVRLILKVLLGHSTAYVRKNVLIDCLATRIEKDPKIIRELVDSKGWSASLEELLSGPS